MILVFKTFFFLFILQLLPLQMQMHISVMRLLSFGKWRHCRHIVRGVTSDGLVLQEYVCLGRFCLCTSQQSKEQVIFHTRSSTDVTFAVDSNQCRPWNKASQKTCENKGPDQYFDFPLCFIAHLPEKNKEKRKKKTRMGSVFHNNPK